MTVRLSKLRSGKRRMLEYPMNSSKAKRLRAYAGGSHAFVSKSRSYNGMKGDRYKGKVNTDGGRATMPHVANDETVLHEDESEDEEYFEDQRHDIEEQSRDQESADECSTSESIEVSEYNEESLTREQRQMKLIKVYSQGSTLSKNDTTLRTLAKSLRKVILPQVKFIQCSKVFGSFEQPDFTDNHCWQNKLYANIPSLNNASDTFKAEVWMTYRAKLKDQFSLHRSGVTLKIKRKFEQGEKLWEHDNNF